MTTPAVSVVVPVYQAAPVIASTMASVCDQTLDPALLEIVLVDDGSTDEGVEIAVAALAARGRRAMVLRHESPEGPSAARNRGWRASSGEWIQFLDADDLLAAGKCQTQWDVARHADPGVAVVFSAWARLQGGASAPGRTTRKTQTTVPRVGDDPVMDLLRPDNFFQVGSYLIRRRVLEQVHGFNEALWLVEDVDLLLRVAMQGGAFERAGSQTPLFWYREQPGSLSRRDEGRFIDACLRNTRLAEAFWRDADGLTERRRRFLAGAYGQAARYLAEHDRAAFDDVVTHMHTLDPAYVPEAPAALRRLTRLVGYRAAERLAVRYRQAKRAVGR